MDQQRSESNNQNDVALAQAAAGGDAVARKTVSDLADPLIIRQTELFCKRFCYDHRFRYSCTLPHGWAKVQDAPYCEWGNASYAWMLEDLTSESRLQRFEGADGARLIDYLGVISHSQPFYERWKDWRFGRRVRAPSYIQELGPDSVKLFLWMRDGDDIANMAQRLGKSDAETTAMASQIIIELTQRNRLHLLDPPKTESLTGLKVGGISALMLLNKGFEIYLDKAAQSHQQILVSAGQRGVNVELAIADLVKLTRAKWIKAV